MALSLYIDNRPAEVDSLTRLSLTLTLGALTALEESAAGYTKTISIPATPHNQRLMNSSDQLHALPLFGAGRHTARVEIDGFVLIEGPMRLISATRGEEERFCFNIFGAACEWIESAQQSLASLTFDYNRTLSPQTVEESWSEEGVPVRFLPVRRDLYTSEREQGLDIYPPSRVLTMSDYHPFLHIATLVAKIFEEAGYTLSSKFMESPLFRNLYMSGRYAERDVALLVAAMEFRASRYKAATAVAGADGYIYCTPLTNYPTLGNIVETASVASVDEEGNRAFDVYDNGDCFGTDDTGRVRFKPLEEVEVSFKYNLHYLTDYRMVSSTRLAGFDTVRFDDDDVREFELLNTFPDRKSEILSGIEYRVVVFGHAIGTTYKLYGHEVLPDGTTNSVLLATFSSSEATFTHTASANPVQNLYLVVGQMVYGGDWAVYNSHITTRGSREVRVSFVSRVRTVKPTDPAYFDLMRFEGGSSGMSLTLLPTTTITPIFNPHPGEGTTVEFADLTRHACSRLELLAALRQMFNLRFYTDAITRTVIVEPNDDFYNRRIVDWSDKVDYAYPIVVEEVGRNAPREIVWRYREGDGAVARYDSAHGEVLGSWSAVIGSAMASTTRSLSINPLFTPSLSVPCSLDGSPSVQLISAGDRQQLVRGGESLNFPIKVVGYTGLQPLPEGEKWDWPSYGATYPHLAFHAPEQGWTLGFEDSDGVEGLHTYWDSTVERLSRARRVTLYLHLSPTDVEPVVMPDRLAYDFRALYRLTIDGEPALYRLEEICDYNPDAPSVKCRFVQQVD